jgi:hypothetical protein
VGDAQLLYLAIVTFATAFIGAFILRAALHAANVMVGRKRGRPPRIPFPSFDWSITLLLIANVINLVVSWIVTGYVVADLAPGDNDDKATAQWIGAVVAVPFNVLVTVLVLQFGLPTTFPRAVLVVLLEFVFGVVFAFVVGAITLAIVLVTTGAGGFDQKHALIGGVIGGVIGALIVFGACLSKLEGSGDPAPGSKPAPAPPSVTPAPERRTEEVWPGTDRGRERRLLVAFVIMVVVFVVMVFGLPRLVP